MCNSNLRGIAELGLGLLNVSAIYPLVQSQVKRKMKPINKMLIGSVINIAETVFHKEVWKITVLKLLIFAINIFLLYC